MATESQVSEISQTGDEGDGGVDLSAVYTHAHSSGEVRSGNVLDFKAMCAAAGSLTLQEAQVLLKFSSNNGETGEAAEESEAEKAEEASAETETAGIEETADKTTSQESSEKQPKGKTDAVSSELIADRVAVEASGGGNEIIAEPLSDKQTAAETKQSSGDRSAEITPAAKPDNPKPEAGSVNPLLEVEAAEADESAAKIVAAEDSNEIRPPAAENFEPEALMAGQIAEPSEVFIQPAPRPEVAIELAEDDFIDIDNSPQPIETIEADSQAFEEEDALIFQDNIAEEEPSENDEVLFISPEAEPDTAGLSPELSAPVQEVEETVELIAARLEVAETEEVEAILDEIILLTAETDELVSAEENAEKMSLTEEETQQRLAELYTELFDQLQIDYTPELVAAFVQLALKKQPGGAEDDKKNTLSLAHDEGTHEAIKQLLAGLGSLKQAIAHAYLVGKSAVRFYIDGLAPAA